MISILSKFKLKTLGSNSRRTSEGLRREESQETRFDRQDQCVAGRQALGRRDGHGSHAQVMQVHPEGRSGLGSIQVGPGRLWHQQTPGN